MSKSWPEDIIADMQRIGLTGSIAVGKSAVCDVFRELGCHVIDADQIARDVVKYGTAGLRMIVHRFGDSILREDGELDRAKLGAIVFADESKRLLLNSIVHPLVFEVQNKWLETREREDPEGIAIVDAALMIESGGYKRFNRLIVVWCQPAIQLRRLMSRDNLAEADAQKRIASQMPQDEKKQYADFLIDTSNDKEDMRRQVIGIYEKLKFTGD
ncbi:MAG: dephospho-CoA kinase [Saprospiraceae bacterium]|nr:dephospho-CoA kinase [Pyrinomonadaceae bacterium]